MNIKRSNTSQVEYKFYNPRNPSIELNLGLCTEDADETTSMVTLNIENNIPIAIYSVFDEVYSYYFDNLDNPLEEKSRRIIYMISSIENAIFS